MTPAVRARRRRTTKGMGSTVVYPTSIVGKRGRWQSTLPTWKHPRRRADRAARSRIAATAPGLRCSSPLRAAPAERFAAAISPGHPIRVFLAAILSGYAILLGLTIALGFLLTRVILKIDGVAAWDERVSRALVRERTRYDGRPLVGRLDPRGWPRDPGPRRAPARRVPAFEALAPRRFHAVRDLRRVGHLPGDEPRRPPRPARREAAREPARRRELPLRAHGSFGRAARRPAHRPRLANPQHARSGSSSGRWPSRSRSSSPGRGCCAACITSPTSRPAS